MALDPQVVFNCVKTSNTIYASNTILVRGHPFKNVFELFYVKTFLRELNKKTEIVTFNVAQEVHRAFQKYYYLHKLSSVKSMIGI